MKVQKEGVVKKDVLSEIALLLGLQLDGDLVPVYNYEDPTDGCICPGHIAVSLKPERETFFGVPKTAVSWN
jgi:hypothetical protein